MFFKASITQPDGLLMRDILKQILYYKNTDSVPPQLLLRNFVFSLHQYVFTVNR